MGLFLWPILHKIQFTDYLGRPTTIEVLHFVDKTDWLMVVHVHMVVFNPFYEPFVLLFSIPLCKTKTLSCL